jgi:protein-tyrosine phosphatase
MIPLVDMHCHLLAGLDDGPRTEAEALEMCRLAYAEGTRVVAAGAHQNERWRAVTPQGIREAADRLARLLKEAGIPLSIFPCAEVMARPDLDECWRRGELLSVGDHGRHLLLELPDGVFVDLLPLVRRLREAGVTPILAHPERSPELLFDAGRIEGLIGAGCLVQVSAGSVTAPPSREHERALKDWFVRGVVHLLGSDGHSPGRRPPRLAEAYTRISRWAGCIVADRVGSTHGLAISRGFPVRVPETRPPQRSWFSGLWGR